MLTLTQTDRMALTQLAARTTLPAGSVLAVRVAFVIALWSFRARTRRSLPHLTWSELDDIGLSARDAARERAKWFWTP